MTRPRKTTQPTLDLHHIDASQLTIGTRILTPANTFATILAIDPVLNIPRVGELLPPTQFVLKLEGSAALHLVSGSVATAA